MEKIQSVDQYIAAHMGDKIVRRAQSPVVGLLILLVGIFFMVLMRKVKMSDSMQALSLTVGLIAMAVGLVLTAMCLSKAIWHYVYQPTRSRMKRRKIYLSLADYHNVHEALANNNLDAFKTISPITSSNGAINLLFSRDRAVAFLQLGRYDTGHFEPESEVVALEGGQMSNIVHLLK